MGNNPTRQCISCREQQTRDNLTRITKTYNVSSGQDEIVINPRKYHLGRSVYICKSSECIKKAIKEKKIAKMLRVSAKAVEKVSTELEKSYFPSPTSCILKEEVKI